MKIAANDISGLLEACRTVDDGFTVEDVVSWVLRERPSMISHFAEAWDEIHRRGMVRVKKRGRPIVYEVVRERHAIR